MKARDDKSEGEDKFLNKMNFKSLLMPRVVHYSSLLSVDMCRCM